MSDESSPNEQTVSVLDKLFIDDHLVNQYALELRQALLDDGGNTLTSRDLHIDGWGGGEAVNLTNAVRSMLLRGSATLPNNVSLDVSAVADYLVSEDDPSWSGITDLSKRLHHWRDKCIHASKRLKLLVKGATQGDHKPAEPWNTALGGLLEARRVMRQGMADIKHAKRINGHIPDNPYDVALSAMTPAIAEITVMIDDLESSRRQSSLKVTDDAVSDAAHYVWDQSRRGNASLNDEQRDADKSKMITAYKDIIRKALESGVL